MQIPASIKIYHICHVDRLPSIVADGHLWSDAEIGGRAASGTTIGMRDIKQRRLHSLLSSHHDLHVGACVPFYFCPRSVMLYLIYQGNPPNLPYREGQGPIIHIEADLHRTVAWADGVGRRWAFTLSNAGSRYFEDRCDLGRLDEVNWEAVYARRWQGKQEAKQAEFLVEHSFPWELVERIGVLKPQVYQRVVGAIPSHAHRPTVEVVKDWYY